ncbi:MAG TPA: DUF308 domain-containing protein [Alphaproteobacteria bacterium]|nr:DUF308 domain-containing protein [Alphaproteobacteria bacterium]
MLDEFAESTMTAAHRHWRALLVEGIVLAVLGVAAIALPLLAGLAIAILFGWLILIGGLVGLVTTLMGRHAPGFGWSLLSAVLWIAAGLAALMWPVAGLFYFTFLLFFWFAVEGAAMIMYALSHRRGATARWGWMLFSGIVNLLLAALLLAGAPGTTAWALGLVVGINLIFSGISLTAMALVARR